MEEYQQRIQAILQGDDSRGAQENFEDLVLDRGDCEANARAFHRRVESIVEEVESLEPPADVQAIQERFLTNARQTADRIGELADRVAAGGLGCGDDYNQEAYGLPSTERAREALEDLEREGYFVFGQ